MALYRSNKPLYFVLSDTVQCFAVRFLLVVFFTFLNAREISKVVAEYLLDRRAMSTLDSVNSSLSWVVLDED